MLKIKEAAEAKGDTPAECLVEEDAYMFIVFDGGDQSVAEVKLTNGATWMEMKKALADKLGNASIYGLRYVDPQEGGKTAMVRNEEEWKVCFAVALQEADRELEVDIIKIPPVKPYKLSLKVDAGKVEKKKIYYPNVYDEPVTFKITVDDEALMSIKEKDLTVPQNEKGSIVLRFEPMQEAKEETIFVKLLEDQSGIQHTVKVNAKWA